MKIAIQGELGSFSHQAALLLAPGAEILPCPTAAQVLASLGGSQVEAAAIPIENSLAGSVLDFYDLFFGHRFSIERELEMRIRHNLIALPGSSLERVRQVLSHPVALAQCREFFAAHPDLAPVPFYDTAGAVRHVLAEGNPEIAAIAGIQAAEHYRAPILAANIEDRAGSFTRFWLIRRSGIVPAEPAPTRLSLVFSLENRPGALLRALGVIAGSGLNLTKIESRPLPGRPWEYMFYADIAISGQESADTVMEELRTICPVLRELGRYSAASASN